MTWSPCENGAHDWRPLTRWHGRYLCGSCGVVGYRAAAVNPEFCGNRGGAIVPYKCGGCGGPTTRKGKRCPACREAAR